MPTAQSYGIIFLIEFPLSLMMVPCVVELVSTLTNSKTQRWLAFLGNVSAPGTN